MLIQKTNVEGLVIIEPRLFKDDTHQFTLRKRRLLKMKPSKYSV